MLTRREKLIRAAPVIAIAWIVTEVLVVSLLGANRTPSTPEVLAVAVAVDVALVAAATVWFTRRSQPLSLRAVVRCAALGLVVFTLVARALQVDVPPALLALAGVAEVSVLAWVALTVYRLRGSGVGWDEAERRLAQLVPARAAAAMVSEVRLMAAGCSWFLRRPVRVPHAAAFTVTRKSQSGFLVPTLILLSLGEMAAMHAVVAAVWPGHVVAHAVVIALHVYLLLWVAGDRRLIEESCHRIEGDALVLELGLRLRARIPLARIVRVLELRSDADRRAVQPSRDKRNPAATPYDAANVHLCLNAPVTGTTFFGFRRSFHHVDLFVDEPQRFAEAVRAAKA